MVIKKDQPAMIIDRIDTNAVLIDHIMKQIDGICNITGAVAKAGYIYQKGGSEFAFKQREGAFSYKEIDVAFMPVSFADFIGRISPTPEGIFDEAGTIPMTFGIVAGSAKKHYDTVIAFKNLLSTINSFEHSGYRFTLVAAPLGTPTNNIVLSSKRVVTIDMVVHYTIVKGAYHSNEIKYEISRDDKEYFPVTEYQTDEGYVSNVKPIYTIGSARPTQKQDNGAASIQFNCYVPVTNNMKESDDSTENDTNIFKWLYDKRYDINDGFSETLYVNIKTPWGKTHKINAILQSVKPIRVIGESLALSITLMETK